MRIIGGRHRSVALASVGKGDAGAHLRPTTDRVRESLFNVLAHQAGFDGAHVLDLFAGTGALGLEALSRGATHATFVDSGRVSAKLIRANIAKLQFQQSTRLIQCDARALPQNTGQRCSLVFLDPPYGQNLGEKALKTAEAGGWLADDALIVWEESQPLEAPEGFEVIDSRKYGTTHITLMSKNEG